MPVTWICKQCGEQKPRNSPPCDNCGGMGFEKFELESVDGEGPERREVNPDGTLANTEESGPRVSIGDESSSAAGGRTFGREALRYVSLLGMAVVIGLLVSVALANIVDSVWVFVAGACLGFLSLCGEDTARETVGYGLNVSALVIIAIPVGQYAPSIFAAPGGEGTLGPYGPVEGITGLVVGLIVAVVIALVVGAVGSKFIDWVPSDSEGE